LNRLQAELDHEQEQLKAVNARQQEVLNRIQSLQAGVPGHVRTASADLKAQPYNQSRTLQLLSQGTAVTVLLQTRSWYLIQAPSGDQGWVYRLMLEVGQ
jgi:SH3-like domain-containing protein